MLVALTYLSSLSALFPLIAAAYNYRYLEPVLKVVALFLLISGLFDLSLVLVLHLGIKNNAPLIHLFIVVSIVFFSYIYYKSFLSDFLKISTVVLFMLGILMVVISDIFYETIWNYPSMPNTILSIMTIILSLAYFYQLFNRQEFVHIDKLGFFWINSGVLFYFSLNVFLFMLFDRMIKQHIEGVWIIHSVTNITANLLYAIGLFCKPQQII